MSEGRWGYRAGHENGLFFLTWDGRDVAQLVWCQRGTHEHVAMGRIVDGLNRPASVCRPSLRPVWSWRDMGAGSVPLVFDLDVHGRPPSAVVVWWLARPRHVREWVQRIVDGLNEHDDLPAVSLTPLDPTARTRLLDGPLDHPRRGAA